MKRILVLISFSLIIFIFASSVNAQMMGLPFSETDENSHSKSDTHESIDDFLPEILDKYGANSIKEINCEEVSDEDFERIGDGVMESIHPGEAHDAMDEMMGGEGSESLELAHINMGRSYLNCQEITRTGFGMMRGNYDNQKGGGINMMGWGYGANMMGTSNLGVLGALIWVAIFVDLVLLGIWLWKQITKK